MSVSAVKAEPAAADDAPRPSGKKGLIKLALIAVIASGAAGGGAWWYLGHKGGESAKEEKHVAPKPPVFYALEPFTVNLVQVETPQFLQTGITLKVTTEAVVEELKVHLPVVRDRILVLMSSRKASDLLTVEGKRQLGEDIVDTMNRILGAEPAKHKPAAEKTASAEKDAKAAAEDEEEKDAEEKTADAKEEKSGKDKKGGKSAEKSGEGAERPVQAVLFTSFIIQ
jgi:flagellar FliL protein